MELNQNKVSVAKNQKFIFVTPSGLELVSSRYAGSGGNKFLPYWSEIINNLEGNTHRLLDFGAGCGIIGLELTNQNLIDHATLSDIDEHCISLCDENTKRLTLSNKVDCILSRNFENIDVSRKFDIIIYNSATSSTMPNNIPKDENVHRWYDENFNTYESLYSQGIDFLNTGGYLIIMTSLQNGKVPHQDHEALRKWEYFDYIYFDYDKHLTSSAEGRVNLTLPIAEDIVGMHQSGFLILKKPI